MIERVLTADLEFWIIVGSAILAAAFVLFLTGREGSDYHADDD